MIETSSDLPRKSWAIFVKLKTFFGKSSEIFDKWSEIFETLSETPLSVCLSNKENNIYTRISTRAYVLSSMYVLLVVTIETIKRRNVF